VSEPAPLRAPRFNHVALSVPAERLDARGCEELLAFYGEVFGWTEMPTLTEVGKRFVLRAWDNETFVFLVADAEPMRCPSMDHFGMSVGTPGELHALLERARRYRERDARVEIVEPAVEDYRVLRLHSFYLRYLLPMSIEVQCYEWAAGFGPQSLPGR
jgi:hypothetical protein